MKKHDIKILNYNDEKYPENLKNVGTHLQSCITWEMWIY